LIWFKHMTDMVDDPRIRRLIKRFGSDGYAVYNVIVERVAKRITGKSPFPDLEEDAEDIADLLRMDTLRVNDITKMAIELGLFSMPGERIAVPKIYEFIDSSQTSSHEMRKLIQSYRNRLEAPKNVRTTPDQVMMLPDDVMTSGDTVRTEEKRREEKRREESKSAAKVAAPALASKADAVIDYLNAKAGKQYRHSKTSRNMITPRLNEGFTVEDCYKVIDTKVAEWGSDSRMEKYLRPETLFRASHFEAYLNQQPEEQKRAVDFAEIERRLEEAGE
jgi:uncharacterized phage protein (TIGR02220 family)